MKTLIATVVTLFCVTPVGSQYVVVNKCGTACPQFVVVNKTAPKPSATITTVTGETIKWIGVTSGCANGNCAVPTQTSGVFLRRR